MSGLRLLATLLLITSISMAQPARERVQVIVTPDKSDWTYQPGEQPGFTVTVLKDQVPMADADIKYEYGPELMKPETTGTR